MPLIDFCLALIVMPLAGAASVFVAVKLVERRNGEIKLRQDIYRNRAKALGYDPDEVWVMGETWATVGAHEDEVRDVAKRYATGEL